jgi:hypothetical protein
MGEDDCRRPRRRAPKEGEAAKEDLRKVGEDPRNQRAVEGVQPIVDSKLEEREGDGSPYLERKALGQKKVGDRRNGHRTGRTGKACKKEPSGAEEKIKEESGEDGSIEQKEERSYIQREDCH